MTALEGAAECLLCRGVPDLSTACSVAMMAHRAVLRICMAHMLLVSSVPRDNASAQSAPGHMCLGGISQPTANTCMAMLGTKSEIAAGPEAEQAIQAPGAAQQPRQHAQRAVSGQMDLVRD